MKKLILLILFLTTSLVSAQKLKTDVLKYKSVTSTERNALVVPTGEHWRIWNSTTSQNEYWDGDSWEKLDTNLPIATTGEINTGTVDNKAISPLGFASSQYATDIATNNAKTTFPGFTSLLADYSFTDNSTNWNTAFGWGDWSTGVDKTFVDALNVDADTFDGLNSLYFANLSTVQTFTGEKTFIADTNFRDGYFTRDDVAVLEMLALNSQGGIIGTDTAHDLILRTNNTQRITIDNVSGDVELSNGLGVGIDPAVELHVKGSSEMLRLQDQSLTGSPWLSFYQNTNRRGFIQYSDSGDDLRLVSEYGGIRFDTGTGGADEERMYLDATGNLDVQGDITANSVNGIYRKKVSLTSAQILALNTTPIEAIAAPGSGKVVVVHQMTAKLIYNTTTYGGASSTIFLTDSSLNNLGGCTILASTSDTIRRASLDGDKIIDENSAIDLYVSLENPTTGDSTVDVYITYEIIEL